MFRQQFRREMRDAALILTLSNINMPGMGGLEMLPQVRALRPEADILILPNVAGTYCLALDLLLTF